MVSLSNHNPIQSIVDHKVDEIASPAQLRRGRNDSNNFCYSAVDSLREPFSVNNRQKNWKCLERKYDLFLKKVSGKGYQYSDFYKEAVVLYAEFKKNGGQSRP